MKLFRFGFVADGMLFLHFPHFAPRVDSDSPYIRVMDFLAQRVAMVPDVFMGHFPCATRSSRTVPFLSLC